MTSNSQSEPKLLRLLLVDDRRDVLLPSGRLLESYGFAVTVAHDGAGALARARDLQPDVIVTDLLMPAVDGEELCRQLREDEGTRHIPVLVYTAVTEAEVLARVFRLGVRVFAIKPCLPDVVGEEARALVERPSAVPGLRIVTGFGESLDDLAQQVASASG